MKKDTYEQELKKDINIIKKDLRAISIKTRIIARELEIEDDNKKTKPKNKQLPWWIKLVITVKGWVVYLLVLTLERGKLKGMPT